MTQSLSQAPPAVRPTQEKEPEGSAWALELRNAIRCPRELCQVLELPEELGEKAAKAAQEFPLIAPRGFVAQMAPGDPNDPLLLQVLPQIAETYGQEEAKLDAVGDLCATLTPGLIQKYPGRALMIASPTCAVHCRYCFRRHFPYSDTPRGLKAWESALRSIEQNSSIEEIILSGGDPLMLTDHALSGLIEELEEISHLRRLRIHTRLPIVIPTRVTEQLLSMLKKSRLTPVIVIHANHANELSEEVIQTLKMLSDSGAMLLNQSVLLKGINDRLTVQEALCKKLVDANVLPYYLHKLDKVVGAMHFQTDEELGKQLIKALSERLPGYAVPRYVVEEPGKLSKTWLA